MTGYALTPEVVRVAIVAGVILSMLFYERAQLTTGGAIVPAYLALAVSRPLAIVVTVAAGYLTHVLVSRVLSKRTILYGRRKFETEVLVGLALVMVGTILGHLLGGIDSTFLGLAGIGFLVPGIIAHDMGRQRPSKTLFAITITTTVLAVFIFVLASLLALVPGAEDPTIQLSSTLGYPRELLLLAVALSVLIGMLVFNRLSLRSGGFITGAYLALVSPRWGDLLFTAAVAVTTWAIVVHVLMPRLLLFGRRKLSTMILVGAIVGWSAEILVRTLTHGEFRPWLGLTVATLMVPALIANDAQRQGWERTIWGTVLTGTGVYAVVNLAAAGLVAGGVL